MDHSIDLPVPGRHLLAWSAGDVPAWGPTDR